MASPSLLTPTSKPTLLPCNCKAAITPPPSSPTTVTPTNARSATLRSRREISISAAGILASSAAAVLLPASPASAASDEEYAKETTEVIGKVRSTINMERTDPNVASAVAELREASNSWVSKYRREKALLGRASFRDIYSALNAVSGHYISFGPTAPIPAKRKARILEEVDTAEKALLRGR